MLIVPVPAGIEKITGSSLPINGDDVLADLLEDELDQEREKYENNLYLFLRDAWRWIDPSPFTPGWHMEAIAEHLEAVSTGDIRRLIINQPPRTSKSSMMVAFDAWTWAQRDTTPTSGPGVQFLHASYAQTLSIRDSVKTRRLIESPWYQRLWGSRYQLSSDQSTKIRFDNTAGGYRLATSVGGTLTGEGGSIILIDDPHNAVDMESEVVFQSTLDWFDNSLSTRLNDPKTGAMVLVMQRLKEEDLTGHILEHNNSDWVHLMLPMRYEAERARLIYPNVLDWSDPRTEEGELLCPERFGEEEVDYLERQMGPFQAAGQLQQRPEPKGGGIIKRDWWQLWDEETYPVFDFIVASLDTAYTEKTENDPSALTVWGVFSQATMSKPTKVVTRDGNVLALTTQTPRDYANLHPKVCLIYSWTERLELNALVERVAKSCKQMKVDKLLIESKASGISVAQEIRRLYGREMWGVQLVDPKSQDKISRLYSVQNLFAAGMVYAPDRAWADAVITQCAQFPKAKHDDLVDTASQALRHLRDSGMLLMASEHTGNIEDAMRHRPPPKPLYDV